MLEDVDPNISDDAVLDLARESLHIQARYDTGSIRVLGRGAHAVVCVAYCPEEERYLVVKLLKVRGFSPELQQRFRQELRNAQRAQSRFVCRLRTVYFRGDVSWLEEEYVPGKPLNLLLKEQDGKPLPFEQAHAMALALMEGLQQAHAREVTHRDIKPENLLVPDVRATLGDSGEPAPPLMILDFGVSRSGNPRTTSTTFPGTPMYCAPEGFMGKAYGAPGDVYSATLVLYELFTGQYAWHLPQDWKTISGHQQLGHLYHIHVARQLGDPHSALALTGLFPTELDGIMFQGLAADPAARPEAKDFVEVLRSVPEDHQLWATYSGQPPATPPSGVWRAQTMLPVPAMPDPSGSGGMRPKPISRPNTMPPIPRPPVPRPGARPAEALVGPKADPRGGAKWWRGVLVGAGIVAVAIGTYWGRAAQRPTVAAPAPSPSALTAAPSATLASTPAPPLRRFEASFDSEGGDITVTALTATAVETVVLTVGGSKCEVPSLAPGKPILLWSARWTPPLAASPAPTTMHVEGRVGTEKLSEDVPLK